VTVRELQQVEPRFLSHPPYVDTLGPEVAALATRCGFAPDPEQRQALDIIFGWRADQRVAAFEFGLVCSRQNMKSALFEMCVLGWLFIEEVELITWSAHELSTTTEAHRHLANLIRNNPDLKSRLAPGTSEGIYEGNGKERIELATGQRVLFKARTNVGGRGLTGDRMILDEALYLTATHMGSLLPTLAAVPDPQVLYGSSAGKQESATLRSIRDRGRAGDDPSLGYIEFSSEPGGCADEECTHALGAPGCALDDIDKRRQSNPALGRRITEETLDNMRRALWEEPSEFAREFLGWWDDPPEAGEDGDIDMVKWAALANPDALAPSGPAALAVDIPPDRSRTSLAVAWRGPRRHQETCSNDECGGCQQGRLIVMVTSLAGTAEAASMVVKLAQMHNLLDISLHAGGPAGSLVADLKALGVDVTSVTTQAMAQATGGFVDLVTNSGLEHLDQPELTAAVRAGKLRNTGDARLWDRRDLTDISPLVASTLAAAGFTLHEPDEYDPLDSIF